MSPLRMGSKQVQGISAEELGARTQALQDALQAGGEQLDPQHTERARAIATKVSQRTSKLGGHTVVALAGATGSGKSSLFNAMVGGEVAKVGARRPTTAKPTAAVWGEEDATELLDWLSVGQRHHVRSPHTGGGSRIGASGDGSSGEDGSGGGGSGGGGSANGAPASLDGLVLLDLPDFDSRETSHRREAERILALVDVFVWVTDPQKYADARLHDDYLRLLDAHDAVTVVVLNQTDRLTPEGVGQVTNDLGRLTAADGIRGVQVLPTSARDQHGLPELRARLAAAVASQNAARHRLAADIRSVSRQLRSGVADSEPALSEKADTELVDALSRAAGIPTVVGAVERDYRRQAWGHTGWPFTRWVRAIRPDPLKRLRLDRRDQVDSGVSDADIRSVLGRSSLPPPSPAARSAVDLATRRLGDEAGSGLPVRWSEAVADAATPPGPELADALDQAVVGTSLKTRTPVWWKVFGILQVVLAAAAVAGLLWLVVLAVMGWLQLPEIDTPRLGPLPYPLLMLVGGLVLGIALAALARWFARIGSRRRGRVVHRRLTSAVSEVASERILAPVHAVLARHARTRTELDRARA